MVGLESLIRFTAVCLLAGAGWPTMQEQIRVRAEDALAQVSTLSMPALFEQELLPTVQISQALASQLLAASSP